MTGEPPRYLVVDPEHRRACSICGSVVAGGETDHHDQFHGEIDRLWAAIEILRRAVPRVQTRLDTLEGNRPTVMVPADAYERLRMLAVQLDGELLAIRQLVVADPGKLVLRRELLTALGRADYWYDTWKDARGSSDAPEWRGSRSEPRAEVDEARLRGTTRADVWAEEFAKVCPDVDQGLMIAWFANAIETGRDAGFRAIP